MLDAIASVQFCLDIDDVWEWIINQIYDLYDARRVYKIIEEEMGKSKVRDLKYDDLVQLLLSYQLAKQQKFIQPLVLNLRP